MVRCIIVDDEDLARALLENYVEKVGDLELVASCASPLDAFNLLQKEPVDLLFLDIQMPEMNGTELFRSLVEKPFVIFTTAYSEYALQSYDLEALDYLLKPIRFERFLKAIQKAQKRITDQNVNLSSAAITIKSGYDLHKVRLDDILYIEGMKEYVAFYTSEKRIITLKSLKSLEAELPSSRFMRVHRSYIIQRKYVTALINKQIQVGATKIPVGERYLDAVKQKLF